MFSETVLKALSTVLLTHKNVNNQYDNWPAERVHGFNQATAVIDSMLRGDIIASTWTIEDVKSLRETESAPCEWFTNNGHPPHWCCDTHMYDGTSEWPATGDHPDDCPARREPVSDEDAREVLRLADSEHDASVGINWDSLNYWLVEVEGE